jgi:hypothetical protein
MKYCLTGIVLLCLLAGCQRATFTERWEGPSQVVSPASVKETGEGRTEVHYVRGCTANGCQWIKIIDDPNGTRFVQPIIVEGN